MTSGERLKAFTRAVGIDFEARQTTRELDLDAVREAVAADPDSAARLVEHFSRFPELPTPWAQIALTVAAMYQYLFDDDTLLELARAAPWFSTVKMPRMVDGETREPVMHTDLSYLDDSPDRLLVLSVRPGDQVKDAVSRFELDGKPPEHVKKLVRSWGRWLLSYESSDPREVVEIPEWRRFFTQLHEALPYFPVYLNLHPDSGMFFLYFGSVSERAALNGLTLDLAHHSVLDRVTESLVAIKHVCRALRRDPEPMQRAVLAVYAGYDIEPILEAVRKA